MKKILLTIPVVMALTACGAVDHGVARLTGHSVSCVDGVEYIQFTSGVTVKYKQDGTVSTCTK